MPIALLVGSEKLSSMVIWVPMFNVITVVITKAVVQGKLWGNKRFLTTKSWVPNT